MVAPLVVITYYNEENMIEKRITIAATEIQLVKEAETKPMEIIGDGWTLTLGGPRLAFDEERAIARMINEFFASRRRKDEQAVSVNM